jgi:hypothetical protein
VTRGVGGVGGLDGVGVGVGNTLAWGWVCSSSGNG